VAFLTGALHGPRAVRVARWAAVLALVGFGRVALGQIGVPAPALLSGLAVGLAMTVRVPDRIAVTQAPSRAAHSVVGVALGATLTSTAISLVGKHWVSIAWTTAAMMGLTVGLGVLLTRLTSMQPATAVLSVVSGGAMGIISMTRDLGGDERIVAVSQYLRVLVIFLYTPLVAALVIPTVGHPATVVVGQPTDRVVLASAVAVAVAGTGWAIGRHLSFPSATFLVPLAIAAVLAGLFPAVPEPPPGFLRDAAFGIVGLGIGLRFTPQSIRAPRELLPALVFALVTLLVTCFGLAALVSQTSDLSLLKFVPRDNTGPPDGCCRNVIRKWRRYRVRRRSAIGPLRAARDVSPSRGPACDPSDRAAVSQVHVG
jgi:membrane AbrB-like protein